MKITLKNIKHAAFASQETHCFEAVIYVDGKRFCHVQNDGHGGCDDYYALNESTMPEMWERIKEINLELGNEKRTTKYGEGKSFTVNNSLEIVVGDLVNEWLINKETKKIVKRALNKVTYYRPDRNATFSLPTKFKPTPDIISKVINHCDWWDDSYVMLNILPTNEAEEYLRKAGNI